MIFARIDDTPYNIFLLLHIAAVIVAFAPAVAHPLITAAADREGGMLTPVYRVLAANGRRVYAPALVLAGLFGIVLVLLSDDAWEFSDAWISLAFLVWIAMNAIVHAVLLPAERRVADGDRSALARVQAAGMVLTVLTVVMLYLMIWKPGA